MWKHGLKLSIYLLLFISSFLFAKIQGGFVSWFIFFTFAPLLLLSFLLFLSWFQGTRVGRQLDQQVVYAGETITVHVRIKQRLPVCYPYLAVQEQGNSKLKTYFPQLTTITFPLWKRTVDVDYQLPQVTRGKYTWEKLTLQTGDWLGIISRQRTFFVYTELLVLPAFSELNVWPTLNALGYYGASSGRQTSAEGFALSGIRNYQPGDKLSHIHWKASARYQELKTKELAEEKAADLLIFFDTAQAAYAGLTTQVFERAVSLVATLSKYAYDHQLSCTLVWQDQQEFFRGGSQRGYPFQQLLSMLAEVEADGQSPLSEIVQDKLATLGGNKLYVFISPCLDEELVLLLAQFRWQGKTTELFWLTEEVVSEEQQAYLEHLQQEKVICQQVKDDHWLEDFQGTRREVGVYH